MTNGRFKILVVDDEESIVSFIKIGLEELGYDVHCAYDGKTAIDLAIKIRPDILILDIMLPKINGYEVCAKIKEYIDTSIIMLTARYEIDDKVEGLNSGADDYMVKPFSFKELVARINVRLRGKKQEISKSNQIGKFTLNDGAHEITYKDNQLELSPTEYKLLRYLLINNNLTLSKSKILDEVWGFDFFGDQNVVEVYIRYLRRKIDDKKHEVIQTIRGVGYKIAKD